MSVTRATKSAHRKPEPTRARVVAVRSSSGTFVIQHKARSVFVKVRYSANLATAQAIHRQLDRESVCLDVLAGLAIPERIEFPKQALPAPFCDLDCSYVAMSALDGYTSLHELGLGRHETVGVWLFLMEQYLAFRRHQIAYSDIKCANLLAATDPLRVRIIDFDGAGALLPRQRRLSAFAWTPGFQPPEIALGQAPTERSIVYQLAALLVHLLCNRNGHGKRRGLVVEMARAERLLGRLGYESLWEIVESALDSDPKVRPNNLENLYGRIKRILLPDRSVFIWQRLRAPFAEILSSVELSSPAEY